nr:MAG TPA: hypothetical protein [Caudoviricetes sp.]
MTVTSNLAVKLFPRGKVEDLTKPLPRPMNSSRVRDFKAWRVSP